MEYLLFSGRWLLLPNNLKSNLLEQCGTRSLEQKYLGIGDILSRFITWCQTLTSSRNISTTPAFIWGRQSKCCKKNKKSEKLQCSLNCVNSKIFFNLSTWGSCWKLNFVNLFADQNVVRILLIKYLWTQTTFSSAFYASSICKNVN